MSNNENTVCNKCFQKGHKLKECTNDWVCKLCKGVGHKQSECTATFSDEQDDEYTQVQDYASDAGTDADASSEGTTTEENPSESEADAPSQSILQPKPIRKNLSMFSEMLKSLNGEIVLLIFSSLHFEQDNVTSNYDINHSNIPEGKIPRGESNTSFIFGYTTLCIADFHNPVNNTLSTGILNIRKMIHKITSSPTVHHPLYIHLSPYGAVEFNMLAGNNKIHIKTHKIWPSKYIFVH